MEGRTVCATKSVPKAHFQLFFQHFALWLTYGILLVSAGAGWSEVPADRVGVSVNGGGIFPARRLSRKIGSQAGPCLGTFPLLVAFAPFEVCHATLSHTDLQSTGLLDASLPLSPTQLPPIPTSIPILHPVPIRNHNSHPQHAP